MYGGTIQNCATESHNPGNKFRRGGGVLVSGRGSVFNMFAGTITGNKAKGNTDSLEGGGVYLSYDAVFNMSGGTISNNTAGDGGGIFAQSDAIVNITGGKISGNTATDSGAGVFGNFGAIFNMSGGEITENEAGNLGGGVYISENNGTPEVERAQFNMSGGSISNNTAKSMGGGAFLVNANISSTGGTVSGNKSATYGGGIVAAQCKGSFAGMDVSGNSSENGGGYYLENSNLSIDGGTVSGNTGTPLSGSTGTSFGAGICIVGNQDTNINGTKITKNILNTKAAEACGGGIYFLGDNNDFNESGILTISNSDISENKATLGSGIAIANSKTVLDNALITNNKPINFNNAKGLGVYMDQKNDFTVKGNTTIQNNKSFEQTNVYLPQFGDYEQMITVGKLGNEASIGVTEANLLSTGGTPWIQFTQKYKQNNENFDPSKFFTSDNRNYRVIYSSDKLEARLGKLSKVIYNSNGGSGNMTDENSPYLVGTEITVKENGFTAPEKKKFKGWNTTKDGSGTAYTPGQTFNIEDKNITLYAQWEDDTHTVRYDANGGSGSMEDSNSPYNSRN